jgi:pyrimidine-nucleoside phosphorylase
MKLNPVDIIVKKRDGLVLSSEEINAFVEGFTTGTIPDYQMAAWAMAVYFQGMTESETTELTLAMAASGDQLDLHDSVPPGTIIVDKHSSGGVGDKTTLAVGPIVAACGLPVGKMSGRGLSFTGGTLDKLESITGWSPDISETQFRRQLNEVGLVIAGQTARLAPADKHLYALRDVTGTVACLPLIAGSIMSKKLAAGADAIVLDVKCGHGAFMETLEQARRLAELMVAIGTCAGRRVTALITQMEQPLGAAVGNSLEVAEAIDALHGRGPADFQRLVEAIAMEMLILGQPQETAMTEADALHQVRAVIDSGAAFAKFTDFVAAQGGDLAQVENPSLLPQAPVQLPVTTGREGYVQQVKARDIGQAVVGLGGGRQRKDQSVEHCVGCLVEQKVGAHVGPDTELAVVHALDLPAALAAVDRVQAAYVIGDTPVEPLPIVYDRVVAS